LSKIQTDKKVYTLHRFAQFLSVLTFPPTFFLQCYIVFTTFKNHFILYSMNALKKHLPEVLFITAIILIFILSFILCSPPEVVLSGAPEDQFSAERAFTHTVQIARTPHCLGTAEHTRIKEYIKNELLNLGLEYGEQDTTAVYDQSGVRAGYVSNLYGILKGNGTGDKAVLFLGHYDSCPHTPGAADDGSAVVSMLEAARALTNSGPFDNDIIFLFTDGEESGLFGAKVFTEEHPLIETIGVVINIEARGSRGPTLAYEFNENNGWIIRELNRAMPRLYAGSIFYEIYKRMPNDTDFTMFRRAGLSGINMAFIDDYANYHSMTDSPENLSLKSLQHHGDFIMASARHFGNIPLDNTKSEDVIFFNWIGSSMIIYSARLSLLLIVIVMVLAMVFFFFGFRKRQLRWGRVLLGSLIFILTLAFILFISWLLLTGIKKGYPHYVHFYDLNFYNVKYYFFTFSALSLTVFSLVYGLLQKRFRVLELFSGILIFNIILMFFIHFLIPTGSYLAVVPLLFLLAAGIVTVLKDLSFENRKSFFFIIHLVAVFPIIGLYLPYINLFYIALGLKLIYSGLLLLIILWGYLVVPICLVTKKRTWIFTLVALVISGAAFLMAHLNSKPSPERLLQTSLNYYFDGDSSRAYWVSDFLETDEWNNQFFQNGVRGPLTEIYPHAEKLRLKSAAPVLSLSPPEMEIISDTVIENRRFIELIISTQREAAFCEVYFQKGSQLIISIVNNRQVGPDAYKNWTGGYCELVYHGLHAHPLHLSFSCTGDEPLEVFIIERKFNIREVDGFDPMPEWIIPNTGYNSYQEIVKKSWRF